jgi:hypothetical protein
MSNQKYLLGGGSFGLIRRVPLSVPDSVSVILIFV